MDDEDDLFNERRAKEVSSSDSYEEEGPSSRAESSERNENDGTVPSLQRSEAEPATETRWRKLHENYSDDYLELFKATYERLDNSGAFEDSQSGATIWSATEKSRFFDELQRRGRHQPPELAAAVGTKSIIEVQDYLLRLREAESDRQRFAKEAKNVSHADIEAAIEIGPECEAKLEAAADALAAFQDQYDLAMAQSQEGIGIVDEARARELDKSSDSQWTQDHDVTREPPTAAELFHLSTMLELSKTLFMNPAADSEHDHWSQLVQVGELPAMTMETIQDLQSLISSLTQRILQTSLFIAQSRQRASSSRYSTTSKFLKASDVKAACEILKLPSDSWNYWRHYTRRSGHKVVMNKSEQRARKANFLTLDQVEAALNVRRSHGRKRSLASLTDTSSINDTDEQGFTSAGAGEYSSSDEPTDAADERENDEDAEDNDVNPTFDESEDEPTTEDGPIEASTTHGKIERSTNPNKRRWIMEQEEDDYLERLDQAARTQEEAHLTQTLEGTIVKAESIVDIGRQPRAERKTNEELQYWSDHFRGAWWETYETNE